jgi:cytochrome c6
MKLIVKNIATGMALSMIIFSCQGKKSEGTAVAANTPPAAVTSDATPSPGATTADPAALAAGKKTFETYCVLCHGADGKLGLNGSKDLSISVRPIEERIAQVTNGKGLMTPFKDILTEAEIKAVAEYTLTLKK